MSVPVIDPYSSDRLEARPGLEPVRLEDSHIKRKATRWIVIAFGAFLLWANYAPIDGGVAVTGTVAVLGARKAVQHPSGGVVAEILTREGATVRQGDVLLKVNPLNSEANLTAIELQYINLLATESRLLAERSGAPAITWHRGLAAYGADSRVGEAKDLQTQFFLSRQAELEAQQRILREQIEGLESQQRELLSIIPIRKEQMKLLAEEAASNRELAAEGFVPRSRANELERQRNEAAASIANVSGELAKVQASLGAAKLQLIQQKSSWLKDIDAQLTETQKNREGLRIKVESLRFEFRLTEVRAPVGGAVVGLKANTVGGVITPGQLLMEIVPTEGRLVVEAQVQPQYIDKVQVGLAADMRFTAFNINTTPVIPGIVKVVGEDRMTPASQTPQQQGEFYLAQIEATPEGEKLLAERKIQPGMPVEVIVKTGERTFLSYLLKPLADRFARAFKGE